MSVLQSFLDSAMVHALIFSSSKDGKMYYYTMNGQSGKVVGKLPLDRGKVVRLFLAVTIPGFLLGLLGGYFI